MSETRQETTVGPLGFPVFRALWIATVVSNVGTWMHDVGAGWLMTSLSPSPLLVALVQAATTLPMFLLALPAGALADIVDRRRMLMAAQLLGLLAAALLAILTLLDLVTPEVLLAGTFMLGIAAALSAPVFQAIVPELVDKQALPDAIALNSLGVNISRAIGPALGGVIVALAGTPAVFALNAVSVVAVLAVLYTWQRPRTVHALPPEHFFGALKAGYRYTRHSPAMRLVLVRAVGFFLFASALWAMLPLIARRGLGLDAAGYGALLGCMGAGAVVGAILLKRLRKRVPANTISVGATLFFALSTLALALAANAWIAGAVMFSAGLAWIGMLTSLNVAAQMASPGWVKARALAVYILVFQGAMAGGSILWGSVAASTSVPTALLLAAAGQAAALVPPPGDFLETHERKTCHDHHLTLTDGTTLFYKDWGPKDAQPIMFHHGWPLSADDWDAQMLFFLSQGYRVIAHDRRGHGRSDQTDTGNDMDTYAADVAEIAKALDLRDAVHIGHSTGGGEVTRYAARAERGRVAKAILIAAIPPVMARSDANPDGVPMEIFDGLRSALEANRAQFYRDLPSGPFYGFNRMGAKVSQGLIDNWWRQGMSGGAKAHHDCIEVFSETDFTEDLKAITVPVMIIHGEDDQIVPIENSAHKAIRLVRDGTLKTYPGLSHGLFATHPEVVNSDMLAFIRA